jgi:uncharacterized membrane protein YbhN (UPF0104 family)
VTAQATAVNSSTRRYSILALKLAVTLGAVAFLLLRQPFAELFAAIRSISPIALGSVMALQIGALAVGTLRWWILLQAYGATHLPSYAQLLKVYFIGYFYNIYVPGGVGGDVLRGVVTRSAFKQEGATAAVAVAFIERALGAAGVLALTAFAVGLFARERFANLLPWCALGMLGVLAGVTALAQGPRLARFAPAPVARLLAKLPHLVRTGPFVMACLLSLVTQSFVAACGHVLAHSLDPHIALSDSFLAMPLAGAAGYFPFTIAGIGPRDALIKSLYVQLGMSEANASATAFAFLFATLATGIIGGIVQLMRPIGVDGTDET